MTTWILAASVAQAQVVFNEILADPDTDASCDGVIDTADDEFVEIVNLGPMPANLTGATLSDANGVQHTFGNVPLAPGDAVVVFGGGTPRLDGTSPVAEAWCIDVGPSVFVETAAGLSLNNGGDDLTLTSAGGAILAMVSYPGTGTDQSLVLSPELYGSAYVAHTTVGPDPQSPGRMVDGGPIVLGYDGPPCDPAEIAVGLVINEIVANPSGADTDLEWVELYNGSGVSLALEGYAVAAGTQSLSQSTPFPTGTILDAGQYLVVGASLVDEADLVVPDLSLPNASSNSDAVQLVDCVGTPLDTVIYGAPNDDGWFDDGGGVAVSLAPSPPDGGSLARDPDGVDTDQSGTDFVSLEFPTPGFANDVPPEGCGGATSGITINELMPNPEDADDDAEWIELFHGGTAVVDLTDWALQGGTSSFANLATFEGGTMAPGDRILVGGELVPGADIVASFSLGNGSNADGLRLVDCAGLPADTVIYGSPNDGETPFVDDSGDVATSLAPNPGEGSSLQRIADGYDTDRSGDDFIVTTSPTPGAPNPEFEPVTCVPSDGSITINEVLPDPDGEDDGNEFVELYNASSATVSVAGWALSAGTQDFASRDVVIGGGVEIGPGDFLVIGGSEVANVDLEVAFSLGNGTDTDGVRLFDCDDAVVDTVLYGDSPNEDAMPDDTGSVAPPYGDPGSDASLARVPDGADTDTAEDWAVKGRATPGATNVVEIGPIDDPIDNAGCGRSSGPPDAGTGPEVNDPNGGGCSVGSGAAPMFWGFVLLVLRRRRA